MLYEASGSTLLLWAILTLLTTRGYILNNVSIQGSFNPAVSTLILTGTHPFGGTVEYRLPGSVLVGRALCSDSAPPGSAAVHTLSSRARPTPTPAPLQLSRRATEY